MIFLLLLSSMSAALMGAANFFTQSHAEPEDYAQHFMQSAQRATHNMPDLPFLAIETAANALDAFRTKRDWSHEADDIIQAIYTCLQSQDSFTPEVQYTIALLLDKALPSCVGKNATDFQYLPQTIIVQTPHNTPTPVLCAPHTPGAIDIHLFTFNDPYPMAIGVTHTDLNSIQDIILTLLLVRYPALNPQNILTNHLPRIIAVITSLIPNQALIVSNGASLFQQEEIITRSTLLADLPPFDTST